MLQSNYQDYLLEFKKLERNAPVALLDNWCNPTGIARTREPPAPLSLGWTGVRCAERRAGRPSRAAPGPRRTLSACRRLIRKRDRHRRSQAGGEGIQQASRRTSAVSVCLRWGREAPVRERQLA